MGTRPLPGITPITAGQPSFSCASCDHQLRNSGESRASVTAHPSLSLKAINDLQIPVPPMRVLAAIVDAASRYDHAADTCNATATAADHVKDAILRCLLPPTPMTTVQLFEAIRVSPGAGSPAGQSVGWREMNSAIPGTVNAMRPCSGA